MLKEHLGRSFSSISFDFRFWVLPKNSIDAMISLMRYLGYRYCYWNGHNLFVHQHLGLYLRVRGMAVQFTSDVIRTIVVRRRHRLALLRNT